MHRHSTIPTTLCEFCGATVQPRTRTRARRFCSTRCMGLAKRQTIANCWGNFWSKVDRSDLDGCWPWIGARNNYGYGEFHVDGRRQGSHRVGWILVHGPIPPGHVVCHTCDNPGCNRPDHWFLGTDADNSDDKIHKWRHNYGTRNGNAKMTDAIVQNIRRQYAAGSVSQASLAATYGVSQSLIGQIVRRVVWSHVP